MAGICGIFSQGDCAKDLVLGTHYLQHRAQDYCGLILKGGEKTTGGTHKGIVKQQFSVDNLYGNYGIGAVSGERQPLSELSRAGGFVTCFDGNIMESDKLKDRLLKSGVSFSGYYDLNEIKDIALLSKIISSEAEFERGIERLLAEIKGDFAVISLKEGKIYAARGWGRKPLILGRKNGSYIVSSESTSFENTGFEIVRDVEPGEVVCINGEGIQTVGNLNIQSPKYCTFEWIYTAYPTSIIDGVSVSEVRKNMGRILAKNYHVDADIVSPVPNSGRWHAIGYSEESGIPYEEVFVRFDYSDRSYTPGEQSARDKEAKTKLIPVKSSIKGKRIVIVDDSIVRGTQMLNRVEELRRHGALEVHARIACPPLMHACMYGKTTKKDEDCIAQRISIEEIRKTLALDSLEFATVRDLEEATTFSREKLCLECWN